MFESNRDRHYWTSGDGETKHVTALATGHIVNIINYARRRMLKEFHETNYGIIPVSELDFMAGNWREAYREVFREARRRGINTSVNPVSLPDERARKAGFITAAYLSGRIIDVWNSVDGETTVRVTGVEFDRTRRRMKIAFEPVYRYRDEGTVTGHYATAESNIRENVNDPFDVTRPVDKPARSLYGNEEKFREILNRTILDRKDWEDTTRALTMRIDDLRKDITTSKSADETLYRISETLEQKIDVQAKQIEVLKKENQQLTELVKGLVGIGAAKPRKQTTKRRKK